MAKDIRVDIGFVGGGSTSVGVPEGDLSALKDALQAGDGWRSFVSGDGSETLVDLSKVLYARVAATSKTVGFAHA